MIDACGNMMLVGPGPNKKRHRARRHIFCRQPGEQALHVHFGLTRREIEIAFEPLGLRNIGEKRVDATHADARQHIGAVVVVKRKITHLCFFQMRCEAPGHNSLQSFDRKI